MAVSLTRSPQSIVSEECTVDATSPAGVHSEVVPLSPDATAAIPEQSPATEQDEITAERTEDTESVGLSSGRAPEPAVAAEDAFAGADETVTV